jgi:formate/nitrite transporter FocA (FNT family)
MKDSWLAHRLRLSRRTEAILAGILFSLVPALAVGMFVFLASDFNWVLALIVGGAMFGLGLDICFGKGCR